MWLLLSLALAAPPELAVAGGLDPAAQGFYDRAEAELAAGNATRAAALYRLVLQADPDWLPASLGLGTALTRMGDHAAAEALYRSLGTEPDAVEALALLLEPDRPTEALALWRQLETLRLGDASPYLHEARLLASRDPDGALAAWNLYDRLQLGGEPDGATLLSLVTTLGGAGRAAEAEQLLHGYLERFPEGTVAVEARARLDRMEVERAAASLVLGGAEPLTAAQEARRRAAVARLAEGDEAGALDGAKALVAEAPRSDAAHALLADVLAARGVWSEAELHAVLARSLAPDVVEHRLRLGALYVSAYGGRRSEEALAEYREAAALRPGDAAILHRKGVLEQALGRYPDAERTFTEVMALPGAGALAADCADRLTQLRRTPPAIVAPATPPTLALPPAALEHYRIALVYAARGRPDAARAELATALGTAPEAPVLLNLDARLRREAGDVAGAEAVLERSLAADPTQGAVLFALGELALARGEGEVGEARLAQAAEQGEADASYLLARRAAERGDEDRARGLLAAWRAAASPTSVYREAANELDGRLSRALWLRRAALAAGLLVAAALPALWAWRRARAKVLRDLLDQAPKSWHEAARLLAALRHEVLKHNTTVLPEVAAALERGDRAPWEAFRARLPEVRERFELYVSALEALGRQHGLRLDLRRKDPVLGPMRRALGRLGGGLGRREPDARVLRACSEAVNERGYRAIGQLVREICILPLRPELVRAVYTRVAAEPGFAEGPVPPLELVDEGGVRDVRMFREDLEDIVANLLRNALSAGARTLRVTLGEDVDPITGQPWVELRFRDDAPGTLTNATIRGRYISRGLGLAVDLLNRHGGTIRVEPEEEGYKAIVVQLPGVEAAPVEVEWNG